MRVTVLIALAMLLAACNRQEHAQNRIATGGGDAKRGKELMTQYGCNACHSIPGVKGPRGMVGPPLDGIGARQYIAGKFPNTPQTMMRWLQNPQAMDPNNAMPNLGVTPDDARDMTAYLATLRSLP
jgi:cytochrome c2